ncbi:glutamate synthase (NADPH/NADH) small chain [Scopulibacillus daqui]|uniref:Glutamate synthase (NADPH/NADH) small chain n=1 Tax=Scopulibacillus daqui TaxID=1469162 RepID=A0ABS2Q0N2_9BACL|nr:glutamate synthase subunit beta [Scopulibacillus daqui]MBM7645097.1 glutamate synthase (NADPH/NADH) small chain [Scopulibacillus daqui]
MVKTAFIDIKRTEPKEAHPRERLKNWNEYQQNLSDSDLKSQSSRCMDCGIPFCQIGMDLNRATTGCPLYNLIPEWNELVYQGKWYEAYQRLAKTNNFPEFTGRACPAPCEGSCTAGLVSSPVAIKSIEQAIIDKAFDKGWVNVRTPKKRTGFRVAVVGSGPAGLAGADQLNQAGHDVTVYEREDRIGGLLMYGIPNMKIDKQVVGRRVELLKKEGIAFITNTNIGKDITMAELRKQYDAVLLCTGAAKHRELLIEGRELKGIYPAMTYLTASTKHLLNPESTHPEISAKGKKVIVIGGGDTGADCVATALRQGCQSVVQFGKHGRLPNERTADNPWPEYPQVFKMEYAYKEAAAVFGKDPREYHVSTKRFIGDGGGQVKALETVAFESYFDEKGNKQLRENHEEKQTWAADLVLIAAGFEGAEDDVFENLNVENNNQCIKTKKNRFETALQGVFAAGDARKGQSLIVWAIQEGRKAAEEVDAYLSRKV